MMEIIISLTAVAIIYGVYDSVKARRDMQARVAPLFEMVSDYLINMSRPSEAPQNLPDDYQIKLVESSIRRKVSDLTQEILYRNNFQITFADAEAKAIDLIVELTAQADRPLSEKLTNITPVVSDDLSNS